MPKQERLTLQQCEDIAAELRVFINETFIQTTNDSRYMERVVDRWLYGDLKGSYRHFDEALGICASKQFTAMKSGDYVGPDYESAYVSLISLDVYLEEYDEDRKSKKSVEWLDWRQQR